MKKALAWLGIAALLIIVVRILAAQTIMAIPSKQCFPAQVSWTTEDNESVESFGCVDIRGDTLLIIPHIVNGNAKNFMGVLRKNVKQIQLLQPNQKAVFKHGG